MSATAFQRMRREAEQKEKLQEPEKKAPNTEKIGKDSKKKANNS